MGFTKLAHAEPEPVGLLSPIVTFGSFSMGLFLLGLSLIISVGSVHALTPITWSQLHIQRTSCGGTCPNGAKRTARRRILLTRCRLTESATARLASALRPLPTTTAGGA